MNFAPLDVSAVICTYSETRWDYLTAAVESVKQQSLPPLEVIVVVDHNPTLLKRVGKFLPKVVAMENTEGKGLAGSRNSGIERATGEIIAFLDDDAFADPDWLAQLRIEYNDPEVIGVGGLIEPEWLDKRPLWFPEEFNWVVGCSYRGMPEIVQPMRNLIGANMSFRRTAFLDGHGFCEGFGHRGSMPYGGEDTEFCIRVRRRWPQKVLLYTPSARVHHQVPASRATWTYFIWRCYLEGKSKALLTTIVGPSIGLASERVHIRKALVRGVVLAITSAILNRDINGIARAIAIVAGLVITTSSYISGLIAIWLQMLARHPRQSIGLGADQ